MRLEKFDSITRARATLKRCVKAEAVSNLPVEPPTPSLANGTQSTLAGGET